MARVKTPRKMVSVRMNTKVIEVSKELAKRTGLSYSKTTEFALLWLTQNFYPADMKQEIEAAYQRLETQE